MWSTGFRSGGFTGRPATLPAAEEPFDPETIENWEFGIRAEWFENRLRTNLTLFMMTLDDKQETVVLPAPGGNTNTIVVNAAKAEYSGFEFEGALSPFDNQDLNIRMSVGYLDAEYDELFQNVGGEIVDIANDAIVIYAPEWTFSLGADYTTDIAGGELAYNVNYKWTDDSYGRTSDFLPDGLGRHVIESYGALDMSLGYSFPVGDTTFTVSVYGQDLLEDGARLARPFDTGGLWWFNTPVMRRNYGVQLGFEF